MLSFEEKISIIEENFPQLIRVDVSLGRVNYHYEESVQEKTIVVYHLHPNGNGFVYGAYLPQNQINDKGYVNIREFEKDELIAQIQETIEFMSKKHGWQQEKQDKDDNTERNESRWLGPNYEYVTLAFENEMWCLYDDNQNLEAAFETFAEAEGYLKEEGFKPRK